MTAIEQWQHKFCSSCNKKQICSQAGLEITICALSKLKQQQEGLQI